MSGSARQLEVSGSRKATTSAKKIWVPTRTDWRVEERVEGGGQGEEVLAVRKTTGGWSCDYGNLADGSPLQRSRFSTDVFAAASDDDKGREVPLKASPTAATPTPKLDKTASNVDIYRRAVGVKTSAPPSHKSDHNSHSARSLRAEDGKEHQTKADAKNDFQTVGEDLHQRASNPAMKVCLDPDHVFQSLKVSEKKVPHRTRRKRKC